MTYYQNPYLGYYPTIQPMVYPQQPMIEQQPQQQSQSVNVQSQSPMDSFFIWVQGEAGAKSYPVARGTTLPLFDTEGDFIYFKSVDNNGIPLPLVKKVLSDPPVEAPVETRVAAVPTTALDTGNYVTKHEYDELEKKCSELENRIMELETRPDSTPATNPHTVQH